ncbi:MAG TPA: type II toxin-antitoxin system VapC family toxin [Candidatus Brocadiaceae bacterium]|nr:type II toxin-antitoxin system VapC family toxin [Candidatus Brocadiaceae bacterium]
MKPALIDTDILSMFFRDHSIVKVRFQAYLKEHSKINLSIITYYEIVSGLKHRDARKQLDVFLDFAKGNIIFPLNENSVMISSEIYADLRKQGKPIDDIDIFIAGIAMANDLVLVTHNLADFGKIEQLKVEDWSTQ